MCLNGIIPRSQFITRHTRLLPWKGYATGRFNWMLPDQFLFLSNSSSPSSMMMMTIIITEEVLRQLFNPHNMKCVQIIIRLISIHQTNNITDRKGQIRIGIQCLKRTPATPSVTRGIVIIWRHSITILLAH